MLIRDFGGREKDLKYNTRLNNSPEHRRDHQTMVEPAAVNSNLLAMHIKQEVVNENYWDMENIQRTRSRKTPT